MPAVNECGECGEAGDADEHGIVSFWGRRCVKCARNAGIDTEATRPTSESVPPSKLGNSRVFKGRYVDALVDALVDACAKEDFFVRR